MTDGTKRPRAWFVNDSGALGFVKEVGASYVDVRIITAEGNPANYSMPLAEYDRNFVKVWRPAEVDDLRVMEGSSFRLPANAPPEWSE